MYLARLTLFVLCGSLMDSALVELQAVDIFTSPVRTYSHSQMYIIRIYVHTCLQKRWNERFPTSWHAFATRDIFSSCFSHHHPQAQRTAVDASMASAASSGPDNDHAHMAVLLRKILQRTREELDEDEEADARDDDEFLGRIRSRRTRARRAFAMPGAPPPHSSCFAAEQSQSAQQQPRKESEGRTVRLGLEQRQQQMRSAAGTGTAGMVVKTGDPSLDSKKKRRKLVYPYPGGIYGAFCDIPAVAGSDGFRQRTGFSREEFDAFYAEQGGDRGHLFKQPRNHYGEHSEEKNAQRRTIRGLLSDRDRVLCWLEMLRHDVNFDEMTAKYGPSKATFHNDFKWMTMAARTMPFLLDVRRSGQRLLLLVYVARACFALLRREFGIKKERTFLKQRNNDSLSSCGSFSNLKTRRFFFRTPEPSSAFRYVFACSTTHIGRRRLNGWRFALRMWGR